MSVTILAREEALEADMHKRTYLFPLLLCALQLVLEDKSLHA